MIATSVQKSSNFKTVFDFYNPKYITWEFYSKYLDKTPLINRKKQKIYFIRLLI